MSNPDFKINLAHALSGAGGGIISMALTYPLITVSSRLQVQKDSKGPGAYKGSRDAIIKILMSEGVSGLYSGLGSAIFGIAITNGVYYYFYELTKSKIINPSEFIGDISVKQSMIASSIAGAATVLITNPIWVVNTRVTTRKETLDESTITTSSTPSITAKTTKKPIKKKIGTLETIINIFDNDGISAFWQGVTPALILVINPIIQYTAFEQLKSRLEKIKTLKNLDFFILGAISKLVATTLTYPYIVMKSRMQLRQTSKGNGRYHSVLDGIKKIIENEGIKGLYKGISSKLLQSVLNAAFLFMFKKALFEKALWLIVYYQRILNIKQKI